MNRTDQSGPLPSSTIEEALERIVHDWKPCSALLLGPTALARWAQLELDGKPQVVIVPELSRGTLPPDTGRFDLVFVRGLMERHDRETGGRLLGALRDLHAGILLVEICQERGEDSDDWALSEMLAYGFRRMVTLAEPTGDVALYRFSLFDYKQTPDWLNPDSWAHPHRWKP